MKNLSIDCHVLVKFDTMGEQVALVCWVEEFCKKSKITFTTFEKECFKYNKYQWKKVWFGFLVSLEWDCHLTNSLFSDNLHLDIDLYWALKYKNIGGTDIIDTNIAILPKMSIGYMI